ncbi:sn-glycerol-1-phosphate dehydrogenase [Planctomyces sp. SH-PL62]|uniref:sn-glycerol-1-phosphate dehydrogenase n=1 Tax=Planctomyces sp. SH-PL62 TaxID=1636152 RepID=UPI00078E0F70|nr:sn-glycerol-1-phosphate dehydrogenase [Planctomyces sp. SH-PL62]AMV38865.1 Glycerol-1-phosphate dehydrogenase [NAD(P)+] [Planctomyces sp. SH-PL62]
MTSPSAGSDAPLLDKALRAARDTRRLAIGEGSRHEAPALFEAAFGRRPAVIVADPHTLEAAGREVLAAFHREGLSCAEPFVFGEDVYADIEDVERLEAAIRDVEAIPVAVGSGTINDLTKLAAHRLGRPYMAVATAASMDGYTAFGASITDRGSKQTFNCPAPRAVVADLEVIAKAPPGMNASGYADLLAKNVAGADWILADAAGVEPIDLDVWETVHGRLRTWIENPTGVARNDPEALRGLVAGLMMSGFAMQAHKTSRPASGADHQFSHLWDMQHHTFDGAAPSHGFKVGIGTLASLALHQELLARDLENVDVERAVAAWPTLEIEERRIAELFGPGELAAKAVEETRAKHPSPEALRDQLDRLRKAWPEVRERLARHLIPFDEVRARLRLAGCPDRPEAIGISRERLRVSYEQATFIRRRFTVLDVARRFGVFGESLDVVFRPHGPLADATPAQVKMQ